MAKRGKETISTPTKRELKDAAKELRKGHSSGGRVLAEKAAAARKKRH
jgi:hypothetical protein